MVHHTLLDLVNTATITTKLSHKGNESSLIDHGLYTCSYTQFIGILYNSPIVSLTTINSGFVYIASQLDQDSTLEMFSVRTTIMNSFAIKVVTRSFPSLLMYS